MTQTNPGCQKSTQLTARRLTLLASVGALAATVLLGGPVAYSQYALGTPTASATEMQRPAGFADIVAKVKPAVISVRVKVSNSAEPASLQDDGDEGPQQRETITGEGSGFFITADGYAVTNNHVIDHAKSVQVTTDDGTVYTAKVVGTDQKTDLALIKVDGKNYFPFVKFAERAPQVGDWVVAVG